MQTTTVSAGARAVPGRGSVLPTLVGVDEAGDPISTRDYYMRRNLAIVFGEDDARSREWIDVAADVADAAELEVGQVLLVIPPGGESCGLPAVIDDAGTCRARFGLEPGDLPALFIADRFGTLFAASHGEEAVSDLTPRDIPRWLEFIACRCS